MYCNHTGLLRLALCPAYTTDCNYDCPCLLCSQHHNHKRQELYLSSGQQQIPPFRDKASKYFGPFYKGPLNANVGNEGQTHAVGCLQHISDALLQACFAGQVCPHSFGTKDTGLGSCARATLCSKCAAKHLNLVCILPEHNHELF